jgi:mRNA interferase RelE/StbE
VSESSWSVRYAPSARRDLKRLDPQIARRVLAAIDRLLDQDPTLDVRRLTGTSEGRIRVGDWRVLFDRDTAAREIVILRVLPRGRAYDR